MTKQRARARKRKASQREVAPQPAARSRMAVFVLGIMLVVMGVLRFAVKGDDFGFPDIFFVALFASGMALFAYFRPRAFRE